MNVAGDLEAVLHLAGVGGRALLGSSCPALEPTPRRRIIPARYRATSDFLET